MSTLVQELVESGVHFGHRSSRWNPKMRPYIYARRNQIHIIDVRETIRGLAAAKKYLASRSSMAAWCCLSAPSDKRRSIQKAADRCGMPYVNDRWLGGTLTNFRTIRSRLSRWKSWRRFAKATSSTLLQEDAVVAQPRVPQDVSQPQRHAHDEPPAGVHGDCRSQERKERGQGSPKAWASPRWR